MAKQANSGDYTKTLELENDQLRKAFLICESMITPDDFNLYLSDDDIEAISDAKSLCAQHRVQRN
ncbi:hypothetical protein [Vibrio diabolicus]|uniref:hypothetical protein n=1 Tax=Vibrio diabolicus TaxID=50719 RepID=UPI00211B6D25|nr:hypothetical protein [Vibrio diabolicus]MCG6219271.1 hypothetical protein [Vibrio diabolicus]